MKAQSRSTRSVDSSSRLTSVPDLGLTVAVDEQGARGQRRGRAQRWDGSAGHSAGPHDGEQELGRVHHGVVLLQGDGEPVDEGDLLPHLLGRVPAVDRAQRPAGQVAEVPREDVSGLGGVDRTHGEQLVVHRPQPVLQTSGQHVLVQAGDRLVPHPPNLAGAGGRADHRTKDSKKLCVSSSVE